MNILITLPRELLDKIISGDKRFEMRKSKPKMMNIGEDGFFVVEKGTDNIRCWCRVDAIRTLDLTMTSRIAERLSKDLCVTPQYVLDYAPVGTKVYLWEIGKIIELQDLTRGSLFVEKNPQQFAYCPLSYGESY